MIITELDDNKDPAKLAQRVLSNFPSISKNINRYRKEKGKKLPDWANCCFLPLAYWFNILESNYPDVVEKISQPHLPPLLKLARVSGAVNELATMATWRYTKGVFEFDDDLFEAVINTSIKGKLPSKILTQLPQWCIYIDTKGIELYNQKCHGVWVMLEQDSAKLKSDVNDNDSMELRVVFNLEQGLTIIPLHLGDWTVEEGVERFLIQAKQNLSYADKRDTPNIDEYISMANKELELSHEHVNAIGKILPLILFICSEKPDISNLEEPQAKPTNPQVKKTKKGWRIFAAENVKHWSVGNRYGNELRRAFEEHKKRTGSTVRPHVRSAHYHTYWVGKRGSEERRPILKFIMPIVVNGLSSDELE